MKKNILLLLLLAFSVTAQKKNVTLEDIWVNATFSSKTIQAVNWMKDGAFYTSLKDGNIVKNRVSDGSVVAMLFDAAKHNITVDNYELSPNEDGLLIATATDAIYRHSSKSDFYVYSLISEKLLPLSLSGKQLYATFSPDGNRVAFVRENNLFLADLTTKTEEQLTTTGKPNTIINGTTDWVYEEEFGFVKGFAWNIDGTKIAFYTFDESGVPEYNMQQWGNLYPTDYRFKYPKAGEKNSIVSISIYDLTTKKIIPVDIGKETDQYIPRIQWTKNPNVLSVKRMNRLQNVLEILHANAQTGESNVILAEKSEKYVDLELTDHLVYLSSDTQFIYASERSGFNHLYFQDLKNKMGTKAITAGEWEITNLNGIDEKNKLIYYTSTEVSPLERHLYCINFDGTNKRQLSSQKGTNTANISPDCQYFLLYHSSTQVPISVTLYHTNKQLKTLEDNQSLRAKLETYHISKKSFFQCKNTEGVLLSGWVLKPVDFDSTKKYPVLMFVYGGPGSQMVSDSWDNRDFYWYQTLLEKGYLVACVDNRGTGARGREFRQLTYRQLGKYEVQDQIDAAKYLASLPYVTPTRIGIWGWSFGGYMSSLCITKGADIFKAAIAVAPVTNWRYYDSIYTERYQGLPQRNAQGYDDNSPVNHASMLKGKYLLIHGTGDDNVHFQNSVMMQDALIQAGKQFQSFYYPNRNHGIYGGNTRLHLYQMLTNFVLNNL